VTASPLYQPSINAKAKLTLDDLVRARAKVKAMAEKQPAWQELPGVTEEEFIAAARNGLGEKNGCYIFGGAA
jgi:hypothetical protein